MDLLMPVLDGLSATRKLRSWEAANNRHPLPIIGLSTNTGADHRGLCEEAGMTAFLPKPLDYPLLLAFLKAWPKLSESSDMYDHFGSNLRDHVERSSQLSRSTSLRRSEHRSSQDGMLSQSRDEETANP